ncbi:hypothetical protein OKW34_000230 [Paraburkholderia youngii]|uniref:hypothetical protein n=1 Tax=Paraburkholderia youngii TaxID=2782701 RepID=UPI003D228F1B
MANVTVWLFKSNDPRAHAGGLGLRLAATRAAVERHPQLVRIENSEMDVDERFIDVQGFTRSEYMTFRIRVLHSHVFSGFSNDGQRRQLMEGEYDARLTLREFCAPVGGERCLRVIDANERGGDLWIKLDDYLELANFPDDLVATPMKFLHQRQTMPDEWDGA